MNKKIKYKTGIIGAGKISYSLTPALIKAGYDVVSISSAKFKSAGMLARKNKVKHFSNTFTGTVSMCDLIFIAVPDSQIEPVVAEIAALKGISGKTFIHLSGTKNISALKCLKTKGAHTAGYHIIQAFPERKPESIKGCYASVEASDKPTERKLREIGVKLGTHPFVIKSSEKILLHIMCVFAANFVNADYYNALLLYKKIKSKLPPIEKLLYPLSLTNLKNIRKAGIVKSLSGPLARKDYDTVNDHIEILFSLSNKDKNFSNILESYSIQTLNLLMLAGSIKKKEAIKRKRTKLPKAGKK